MTIDYEALWRKAGEAHKNAPYGTPYDEASDQAAATVLSDAFNAELAEVRAELDYMFKANAELIEAKMKHARTIVKRNAEIERLREAARNIMPYLRWTVGSESPGHHPTMPSAVDAFAQTLGDRHHD